MTTREVEAAAEHYYDSMQVEYERRRCPDPDDFDDRIGDPKGRDVLLKNGQRAEILATERSDYRDGSWHAQTFGDQDWFVWPDGTVLDDDNNEVGKVD